MKIFNYILCVFLTSITYLFPQDFHSRLISIPLNDDYTNSKIEKLELPILHMYNDMLFTLVTNEILDDLKAQGVIFNELGDIGSSDRLQLISSKNESDILSKISTGYIIHSGKNFVLTKNAEIKPDYALRNGIEVVQLNGNRYFKNEKRIWLKDEHLINDSLITNITSSVNSDSVRYFIQSLQNFQTRYLFSETRDSVAQWIKHQFLQMGISDVVIDSFLYQGIWQKNVVATLPGMYEPDVYNIVGGHHDSYSSGDPMIFAPGADDNASGTAAVLEIARVIRANNYQPESTIKFITFAAEEYGLWGSKDYAQKALDQGMNIKIMINHDMISHTYYPANQSKVDINRYTGFDYIRDLAFYCTENYSLLAPANGSLNSAGSDSYSFWERGFPSVYFEENNFSPYYHSPADTIGNYSMEYCAEVIKSSCATLLMNIAMPTSVENYSLIDLGTGNSLMTMWSPNESPDFENYKIYLGSESGVYDSVYTTTDTLFVINNLTNGNLYYVGVSVLDQDGFESLIVERSAMPLELPLAPKEFIATPLWHLVELSWHANSEYDLYGYNIYRSSDENLLGEKLNQSIYLDTTYVDNTASNGIYYYYTVKAVDSLLNESINNTTLRSRTVSLDQGVLIVDETDDGDGSPMNPTDEEVDNYFDDLLSGFNHEEFDLKEEGEINLSDLGAYSTVIWHGNDVSDMSSPFQFRSEIKKYLNFGGNFLYTGYKPAKAFENIGGLSGTFTNGDFIYDYLKIEETQNTFFALFNEAVGSSSGYINIFVDSLKTLVSNEYHLKNIEKIKPSSDGIKIFTFGTNYDSSSQQGSLKGEPVGVEYIGSDYKTVTISYPLYYMNKYQAKSLIQYVLVNKFDEVLPVDEESTKIPNKYKLSQNYPNPFNPSTTIRYEIPESGLVKIKVFDVLGNEIETLVNEEKPIGHFEVEFDGSNLTSGIYFYQLRSGSFVVTKKMILIK